MSVIPALLARVAISSTLPGVVEMDKRTPIPFLRSRPFFQSSLISMLGVALHLAMDFSTSYGTRLLSPFDWTWYSLDWMPIIDIYLLAALGAGLVLGGTNPDKRRQAATVVLALMAANYVIRGVAHHQALAIARVGGPVADRCAPQAPSWFLPERWPPEVRTDGTTCLVEMAALPTFGSPVAWTIVASLPSGYELRDLNIIDRPERAAPPTTRFLSNDWTPAVVKASRTRLGQIYLRFSRFPAARSFVDRDGSAIVLWTDMRFVTGIRRTEQGTERTAFSAVVRLDPSGTVIEERFGP